MKEKILSVTTLAQTKKFSIEWVDIDFANGNKAQFERVVFGGTGKGVAIVAVDYEDDDLFVYLIEHFCVGTERRELMIPGGQREESDTLIQAANKELQEEIGYASQDISFLLNITSPGYVVGSTNICLAKDLYPSSLVGDEIEDILVKRLLYQKALDMITEGHITDYKTVIGLLYVQSLLNL